MKEAELTDLLKDWRDKARWGDQETKTEYLNKINRLTEELARITLTDNGLMIQPYQREDGSYTYTIKVPGAYGGKQ